MSNKYPHVYAPITIRGVYYKNRLELSPPGGAGAGDENGYATPGLVSYFRPFARGGAAVVTVGNCSIDRTECFDEPGQLDLSDDGCIRPLTAFTEMCNTYGAVGQLEINHCGATQGNIAGTMAGETGFAPSAIITPAAIVRARMAGTEPIPTREMSKQKIEETIQKFAASALRCKKAGMKSVMFHGAHGNLLAQFFSPFFNKRTDEYGGSIKNRARFAVEMLDAVRAAVGEDVVIEYRMSGEEHREGHTHFDETIQFVEYIKDKVDILHVSGGLHDTQGEPWVMRPMVQPYTYDQMFNVRWAAEIKKKYPDLLINVVGSIKSPAQAEEIIASGKADFVAFMRGLLADPDMPAKYASGREHEHMPCLRCQCMRFKNGNFSGPCTVNPMLNYSRDYPDGCVPQANRKKNVGVIGGGPAGIQAVKTLLERGHSVTLYEKNAEIGGQVIKAAAPSFKKDIVEYLDHLRNFAAKSGARVITGVEATPELIAKENFDALIVAIGANPLVPDVPGIGKPHVKWAPDVDAADIKDGAKVVIVGAGSVGIECGIELGRAGKDVTIIEMAPTHGLAHEMSPLGAGDDLLEMLEKAKVPVYYNTRLTRVEDGQIFTDSAGEPLRLPADVLLLAAGMKPRFMEGQAFRAAAPNTEVYLVGDCVESGDIRDATRGAFNICRAL